VSNCFSREPCSVTVSLPPHEAAGWRRLPLSPREERVGEAALPSVQGDKARFADRGILSLIHDDANGESRWISHEEQNRKQLTQTD
jgi:hypothetical protein